MTALPINPAGIPALLKAEQRWFRCDRTWNAATQRYDKTPRVKWGNPANWSYFDALRFHGNLVPAFVIGGGYVSYDADKCVDHGVVRPDIQAHIDLLNTYTELSLSGTGIHCIGISDTPLPPGRHGELWDAGHYLVITGQHLPGTPTTIEKRTDELSRLAFDLRPFGAPEIGAPYQVPSVIREGSRHGELFRLLRSLKALGTSKENTRYAVEQANNNDQLCVDGPIDLDHDNWFNRSWDHYDRPGFNAPIVPDEMFRL